MQSQRRPMRNAVLRQTVITYLLFLAVVGAAVVDEADAQQGDYQRIEERIEKLIGQMTLEEKTTFLYGRTMMDLRSIDRLGIPSLTLADGPLGCRRDTSTAFPASIMLASSWNVELANKFGVAIGKEYRNKGRRVWLGPCINIVRVPQGGRNFETYGEDPFLNGRMAVATITGAQSQSVISCVKHFACNNQEFERFTLNVEVDRRPMYEIYLPAFKAAITEGNAWSIMTAYNRLNGPHCTESRALQRDILKRDWGFDGFVVSDWGAVHDTVAPANNGMDLEMDLANPVGQFWGQGKLLQAVKAGKVTEATIDDKVRRILRAMAHVGALDHVWDVPNKELVENREVAREIARQGMVLLKNDNDILPLKPDKIKTIAVIGPASERFSVGGGGSSEITPHRVISPLAGITESIGYNVRILHEPGMLPPGSAPEAVRPEYLRQHGGKGPGLLGEYFDNRQLQGKPVLTRVDSTVDFHWLLAGPEETMPVDNFSVRWSGILTVPADGLYDLSMTTDDGVRLYLDGKLQIDDWNDHAAKRSKVTLNLERGREYDLRVEYYDNGQDATAVLSCAINGKEFNDAVQAAAKADVVLLFVGLGKESEGEGGDRQSIDLPGEQVELIKAVARVNPMTVVTIIAGSQMGMTRWLDDVPAVLQAWYPGQEGGYAIADVVLGKANPSGKLTMSFIKKWADHFAFTNYPGGKYTEGVFVGYRYYDTNDVEPLFPFGYGLSYTSFKYSNLQVRATAGRQNTIAISYEVTNTGKTAGAEVSQVYVRPLSSTVSRPVHELKAFDRTQLDPGETRRIEATLDRSAFAYFDAGTDMWRVDSGACEIQVGASSRDIRLREKVDVVAEQWSDQIMRP